MVLTQVFLITIVSGLIHIPVSFSTHHQTQQKAYLESLLTQSAYPYSDLDNNRNVISK